MKKIKSKAELDKKLEMFTRIFSDNILSKGNIADLREWFKENFNEDIVQVGDKLTFDFHALFNIVPDIRKKFKNKPIQPITVTYKRADIIFYTYDNLPELGEEYIMWSSDWTRWLYPNEIKQSVLWKHKESLKEKNPNEYYLQVNLFNIDDKFVNYIKDIDFSDYK